MLRLGIDIGGTFTDLVAYDDEAGDLVTTKVPTTPENPEIGCFQALESRAIAPADIGRFIHGTTLVTNLLLERRGAKVGLLTTDGFRDVLQIQRADRESSYDPQWTRPEPLIPRWLRLEVRERIDGMGAVIEPLDLAQARDVVAQLLDSDVEAIAVTLLHAYANPVHERQLKALIEERAPHVPVCISSDVCPQIREYERTSTTAANAYSIPRVRRYVAELERAIVPAPIWYINAAGRLIPPRTAADLPIHLCLSGPAGGVLAGHFLADHLGMDDIITMDMGGTSCDVCLVQGRRISTVPTVEVEWGMPIQVDCMAINTVGAGGGSIGWIDAGGAVRVGPQSAGANPGPACYGHGGIAPTVTDANLVLGILDPGSFLGGRLSLFPDLARESLERLGQQIDLDAETLAIGVHRLVNAGMAQAIREVTVQKGIDPRSFTLVAFGGAAGQHAAEVAQELGISRVLFPANASVLSAFGMVTADLGFAKSRTLLHPLDDAGLATAHSLFESMLTDALRQLELRQSRWEVNSFVETSLDLRYTRQSYELTIPLHRSDSVEEMQQRFEDRHEELYGTRLGGDIDIVTVRLTVRIPSSKPGLPTVPTDGHRQEPPGSRFVALVRDTVAVHRRHGLVPGTEITGPCIVEEVDSTIYLPEGTAASMDMFGNLRAVVNP